MQSEHTKLLVSYTQLGEQFALLQASHTIEIQSSLDRCVQFEGQLSNVTSELSSVNQKYSDVKKEYSDVRKELLDTTQQCFDATTELSTLHDRNLSITTALASAQSDLNELRAAHSRELVKAQSDLTAAHSSELVKADARYKIAIVGLEGSLKSAESALAARYMVFDDFMCDMQMGP